MHINLQPKCCTLVRLCKVLTLQEGNRFIECWQRGIEEIKREAFTSTPNIGTLHQAASLRELVS